ncbi:T1SS secreted agglutinin RTX [Pseudomonas chlororaphis subsp. aureofaciens]|uniref:Ig-like domain-containing protein n=1 Tax=Pseudomonas chlororaphis TaxID=587753 RepID=UPI000F564CFF|nr:Ig-like domain-containing protein [Pseudomonas chlororaphis]AZE41309.1 T1SS secreted agglutinin RTX [Pseudomonas chlororaphis subsp. aureofaciens]
MSEVFIFDKKTQSQVVARGQEIVLESASVVVLGVARASIKKMTRNGQSLVIELTGNEKLVIKKFFNTFEGQDNALVLSEDGQLVEAVIGDSVGVDGDLVVSYEPFQQSVTEVAGDSSILRKMSVGFAEMSPLAKGALFAGSALGIYALAQSGGKSGGGRGNVRSATSVDATPPDAPQVNVSTKANGTMAVSGMAEPGSRIDFIFPDGSKQSIVTGTDGRFSFASLVPQNNGTYQATAIDAANNASKPTTGTYTANPEIDTTSPPPPSDLQAVTQKDGTVKVSGKAEPNSKVTVTLIDGTKLDVQAGPDGSFELISNTPQSGGTIQAVAIDAAGNVSVPATVEYVANPEIDTTAPNPATGLTATTTPNGGVKVSGIAEPNSKVTVTLIDGTKQEVQAGPDGGFELISKTPQGSGTIQAVAIDAAGNVSVPATVEYVANPEIDTTAPNPATGLTATTTPNGGVKVSGIAEPNSTVTVTPVDGPPQKVQVGPTGIFELIIETPQSNGMISVEVTDGAGNVSASTKVPYTANPEVDTTAPTPPSDLQAVTQKDGTVKVSGKAEPNSKVTVTLIDGTKLDVQAGPDGSFELISNTPQSGGTIQAVAIDAAGNVSVPATVEYVANPEIDTTAPNPATGLTATTTPNGGVKVSGIAEPNSTVTVTPVDGPPQKVQVGPTGIFELIIETPQSNGMISVEVTDGAGNVSASTKVPYTANPEIDTTAPNPATGLTATTTPNGGVKVSGIAEPNSTVTVTPVDGPPQKVQVGPTGIFELIIETPQSNGMISVEVTDGAGNVSASTKVPYTANPEVDTTAPTPPSDLQAVTQKDGTVKVSGKAEPNSKVTVTLIDGTKLDVQAGPDGSFELISNTPQSGGTIQAVAIDAAGNVSVPATVEYVANPEIDTTAPNPATGLTATTTPNGGVKVSGIAEPNSTVTVTPVDGPPQKVQVGPTGIFELIIETPQSNGMISVEVTDGAGNVSASTKVPYTANPEIDTTAPTPPSDLQVVTQKDGTVKVSGKAEPNSKVTVTLIDGTKQEVQAGPDGGFELISKTPQGSGTIQAVAIDAAGNVSVPATVEYVANPEIDTTAPTPPSDLQVVTQKDGTVKVSGKAEPNSKVTVTLIDGTKQEVQAGPDGGFELISKTPQGSGTIQAVAIDAAGNVSVPATVEYVANPEIDTTAPTPPSDLQVVTQKDGTVKVSGKAEPNSKVTVTLIDGTKQEVQAGPDGGFELISKTPQGSGTIQAVAIDAAGNVSVPATVEYVANPEIDTTAPTPPSDLQVVTQKDGTVKVSGKAEPNSKVTVTLIDGTKQEVQAGPDGGFELISKTPQGSGTIQAVAIDAAGNVSVPATVEYVANPEIDTTAPTPPSDLQVVTQKDGTVKVSGKAEPNSKVTVTLIDGTKQEVQAGPDGGFELISKTPQGSGTIQAVAIDAAGNVSVPATVEYVANPEIDTTAPNPPTDLAVTVEKDGRATLKGKAEPNSTVTVTFTDGATDTVQADTRGDFTLTSAVAQNNTGDISATAKDGAGNESLPATITYSPGPVPDAPVFSSVTTDEATGLVTIAGAAQANLKVQLTFPDKTVKEMVVGSDGQFSFTSDAPQEAAQFSAVAIQESGQSSTATFGIYEGNPNTVYSLTVDGYIDDVSGKEVIKPIDTPTNDRTPTLYGTSQGLGKNDRVVVFEDGKEIAVGVVSSGGRWSAQLPLATEDGVHNYTIQVLNALNKGKATTSASLTIDTIAPIAPTIEKIMVTAQGGAEQSIPLTNQKITDAHPQLSGKAEAGSTVILYHINTDGREAQLGETVALANGTWTFSRSSNFLVNRKHELFVKAQDKASNLSAESNKVDVEVFSVTEKPANVPVSNIWSVDGAGDVDGDGFDDIASGSYTKGWTESAVRGVLKGSEDIQATGPKFYNQKDTMYTYHQAGVGDTNGDGFNDIVAMYAGTGGESNGGARLYLGGGKLSETGWSPIEEIGSVRFVASAGDLDGDGLMDTVWGGVGARGQEQTSSVRFGSAQGTAIVERNFNFGTPDKVGGQKSSSWSGAQYVTSAGDFNGDGIGDIVTSRGIIFGKDTRENISKFSNVSWKTGKGSLAFDQVQAVSGIGDANGDGYADVAVHDGKNVFVIFGGPQASNSESSIRLEAEWLQANNRGFALDTSWMSTQPTRFGDIRGVGDVNGDGLADFVYTTYGNKLNGGADRQGDAEQGGTGNYSNSYVIFGKADTGTINVKDISKSISKQGIMMPRDQADGASVAGRIDLNGDGLADIYVGSYSGNGKLYMGGISLGAEPSVTVINGAARGDEHSNFIVGSAGSDTIYGKGGADVIYSGAGDDTIVLNQDNLKHLGAGFNALAGLNGRLARVDGGHGVDKLAFESDVTSVDLTTISNAGLGMIKAGVGLSRIANIERIDLSGTTKGKLTLELRDVMDMNAGLSVFNKGNFSSGLADKDIKRHQIVIDGTSENTVEVKNSGEWVAAKAMTVHSNGHAYDVYNSVGDHKGQLLIDQVVNVSWA